MCSNLITTINNTIITTAPVNNKTALIEFDPSDYSVNVIKELADDQPFNFFTSSFPNIITPLTSNSYFINQITNPNPETRLGWVSSLTEVGTVNIEELDNIENTTAYNSNLFFLKQTESLGRELWKSDGTVSNTILSDNINKYPFALEPSLNTFNFNLKNISKTSNYVIYYDFDAINGLEPRSFNNTNDLNSLLADINTGVNDSSNQNFSGFVEYNNMVFFAAFNNDASNYELWKTDGTALGTSKIIGFDDNFSYVQIFNYINYNGLLYFTGRKGSSHYLFSTDGNIINEIKNFGSGTNTFDFVISNDNLFYLYNPSISNGAELWVSDGTETGTIQLKTFRFLKYLAPVGNEIYFSAYENFQDDIELWKTDGTSVGTIMVTDIVPGVSSEPKNLSPLGSNMIYSAYTEQFGRELWVTDGTSAGTSILKDINPGINSSIFEITSSNRGSNTIALNNEILFTASDGITGIELWKTDGTENGTILLRDINTGSLGSNPKNFVLIEGVIYFQASTEDEGAELWKTDGTTDGTVLVTDLISPGVLGSVPQDIIKLGDDLFFTATTPADGRQLWRIDNETLNLDNLQISSQSILFPNPTSEVLNIKPESNLSNLKVFDINGRLVKSYKTVINNQIDISTLNAGIYFVQYITNNIISTEKIIKKD